MDFWLFFFACEVQFIKLLHVLLLIVVWCFHLQVWVWQMSECEHFLRSVSTWECSWVDLDYVRQLKWIKLLRYWNSRGWTLESISVYFIPYDLTWYWQYVVTVSKRNIDSSFFQELLCRN
jgi:hypothetical protein